MSVLIDGKALSAKIRAGLAKKVASLKDKYRLAPGLAVVLVGEDPSSKLYVGNKIKACNEIGIYSENYTLSENTSKEELIALIDRLNASDKIHGILVQLPLPKKFNAQTILERIDPEKDVDGLSEYQTGRLVHGLDCLAACTPSGVMVMLDEYGIDPKGKTAVVIGRSNIVGKPMAQLLTNKDATVTVCHSKTKDLSLHTLQADIIVAALGKPRFLKADMVKQGAVIIDVGTTKVDGVLYGDVDFPEVSKKASFITPVPGGVGPMTIAMLMKNTVDAFLYKYERG
ncbi:MAG: bifunctional methylenetetrahydrofolate dehydrogenase/methenyltetrahydrofolate cyclohydrolase FolD [Christensenellales bacterium]|jgi:methylenetetrahydrofolate dehydrogenase (NADP+)/methenyltetrahydrofolate cyclohydrolase